MTPYTPAELKITDPFESIEHAYLKNGMEVCLYRDACLPIVSSMMLYRVGSRHEKPGTTGVSHFIEHMLFKGSKAYGKGAIDNLSLSCGGSNNAYTFLDATVYSLNLPAAHWQEILKIEADRMQHALFAPVEIEAERDVILEEWQNADDDPDDRLWETLSQMALLQHPYRQPVLGWPQDIRALNRESLMAHYRQHYTPQRACLILAGDLPADALEQIESAFAAVPAVPDLAPDVSFYEPPGPGQRRLVMQREEVTLARLLMCWPAPALSHPDYYALLVLHYLLSEGWSSRLHQELVESQQLASDISTLLFETHDPYLFWLQADVSQGTSIEALETAIDQQIEALQRGEITQIELDRAKQQLLTDWYLHQETNEDRAEFMAEILSASTWSQLQTYAEAIQEVSLESLIAAAQNYLQPELRSTGHLLPLPERDDVLAEESDAEPAEPVAPRSAYKKHQPDFQPPRAESGRAESLRSESSPAASHLLHSATALPAPVEIKSQHLLLPNGLKSFVHQESKTPLVCLEFYLPVGSLLDPTDQQGLANLTLTSLMKGTQQRSARDFAEALENVGAHLSLGCALASSSIRVESLKSHLPEVLSLLNELLTQPLLSPDEVNKEKQLIITGLQQSEEYPHYLASRSFLSTVYQGSGAETSVEGSLGSLPSLQPEAVRDFFNQYYHLNGARLAIAGDLAPDQAADLLSQHFGMARSGPLQQVLDLKLERQTRRIYRHLPLANKEQSFLMLGHLGVARQDPDYVALLLLDIILGSGPGFASRLPRKIRDEWGLVYHIGMSATAGSYLYPGVVQTIAECAPDKVKRCVGAILDEIRLVQSAGVTQTELDTAKAYLSGQLLFQFETNAQRCHYLLQKELFGWPENHLQNWLEQIADISCEQLLVAAQTHLSARDYTLITAGPRPDLKEEDLDDL